MIVQGICQKKSPQSGLNWCQNFAFACASCFSCRVITWLEPWFNWKTSPSLVKNFKKHTTLKSSKHEPPIWSHDTGQQIACFDSCLITITWMTQINDVAIAKVQPSYFSKYWCTGIWTYVQSVMWLVTFSKVWGSCVFCARELFYKFTYYLHHSKGSLYFVCFHIGVTYQTSVIENCSEADWDEVGWVIILI